jgi:acetoin utilization deacetylase AcuC-like enzyme
MTTALVYSDQYLRHDTGAGHPERAERLKAVIERLDSCSAGRELMRIDPAPLDEQKTLSEIARVHIGEYVQRVRQACKEGWPFIDTPDSAICHASYEVALLAVQGVLAGVDAVMTGKCRNVFCAVRPPGHHAEADRSLGFCLFNNIAIAARHLLEDYEIKRVLILDWDVHHGNGTQHTFEAEDDVLYISMHEDPRRCYPGTGWEHEHGKGKGEGFTMNLVIPSGTGDEEYIRKFEERAVPVIEKYEPQFILISAGFDSHEHDPLAGLNLTQKTYDHLVQRTKELAAEFSGDRLAVLLEGGYDLKVLADGAESLVRILQEPLSCTF